MLELIERLLKKWNSSLITGQLIRDEIIFISDTLELMRDAKEISNDAYLEFGSIQGGLSVISSLLEQDVGKKDILPLLNTLQERTRILNVKYPKLNKTIESGKYGYSITSIKKNK